jgi:hypothetical protein
MTKKKGTGPRRKKATAASVSLPEAVPSVLPPVTLRNNQVKEYAFFWKERLTLCTGGE